MTLRELANQSGVPVAPGDEAQLAAQDAEVIFAEMVVEHKGFRGRWLSSQSSACASEPNADNFEGSLSDVCNFWEHVEPSELSLFDLPENAMDDNAASECIAQPTEAKEVGPRFMRPKPKAKATPSEVLSSVSLAVKRTADEMASMQIHKLISDVKQPWQMGPLSSLFSKPKPLWERLQRQNKMSLVGISDHITASTSSSSIPKPIQQTELTVQRIRASRLVTSQDDYRHLALSRFKTMVLLDLEATRLGQSLRSFAGTLCPDDELAQIFMDVFCPKSNGNGLEEVQLSLALFMLASITWCRVSFLSK